MSGSSAGRWDVAYRGVTENRAYGDSTTYRMAAEYLVGMRVEDWGCGLGWMRHFIEPSLYTGIDGTQTKFSDKVEDLCEYRSETEGLFMRHVLEHNDRWLDILRGAVASYTARMVLVLFTPYQTATRMLAMREHTAGVFIPDIGFAKADIQRELDPFVVRHESLATATQYGIEHVWYCDKGLAARGT